MERKERLEKILNKTTGNPNHDKEGKFTFAPYKKYPGLQQSVKKLITIKKAEKGLTEKYLEAVNKEREKLFDKFKKSKSIADDELGYWNDGKYMYTWLDQKHEVFSDIDVALSKAILKESKERPTVYRTQVDSENPGKMEKSRYASWSPDLEYVCKWARFLAGRDSKIDIFKNKPTLENIKIIPDVLYSSSYLRNKAKYQEYILENKSSIEAFEHGLSRHDVYEKYINSIDLISRDSVPFDFYIKYNGGPGSGNFNPGQGRGVGKPSIKTGEFVKSSFPSLKMSENSKKFYEKLNPKIQESFEKCVDRLKKTNISLDNVELEFVNSNTSGGDNGWVNVVDGDNIDSKMIVNLIKPVLKKFTKKEQDVYKHSFVADNSSEAIIDHEFGHIVMYKKAAEIGIKPKSAHLFAEMIVKNEAKKLNIDLNDKSTENFSEYAHRNYTEFIAEAYSRPDYSKLTQNVSDSLLNNKYSKDDFKNFIMEFSGIQTNENNSRINRLVNLEKILNGGPGSGNFNPGQGRGIGKPTNGIKFSKSVNNYFKTANKDSVNTLNEEIKNVISDGLDLSDVNFEIVDSLGNTNGQVVTDDAETMNPKFTLRFEKSVFNNFYPKENDKEVYKWSGQADSSTRGMIRHELGHLFHFKKSLQAGITPDVADDFAEFIVRKEADKLGIDIDKDNSNDNFSRASRMDYGEFIAESYSRPDYSNLTQNVVDAFKNNKYSKEDYSKYLDEDLENLMKMEEDNSVETNGGPGSGNFNPGQGRGVGKPAKGIHSDHYKTYDEAEHKKYIDAKHKLPKERRTERQIEIIHSLDNMGVLSPEMSNWLRLYGDEEPLAAVEKALSDAEAVGLDLNKIHLEKLRTGSKVWGRSWTSGKVAFVGQFYDGNPNKLYQITFNSNGYHTNDSLEGLARHEIGHLISYQNALSQNLDPVSYCGRIVNECYRKIISEKELPDLRKQPDSVISRYGKTNFNEAIAESWSNPDYSEFTKEVYNMLLRDSMNKKKNNSLELNLRNIPLCSGYGPEFEDDEEEKSRNDRLDAILNGGPGSGNFNPGQGRGVGKPANGSNKYRFTKDSTKEELSDMTMKLINEFLLKKEKILNGAKEPQAIKEGIVDKDSIPATEEQLEKIDELSDELSKAIEELKSEYYKAKDNFTEPGFYKDSEGNIYEVVPEWGKEDYGYDEEFQKMFPIDASRTKENTFFVYKNQKLEKASDLDAVKSLKEGMTLRGISKQEERVIKSYTYATPQNAELRKGTDIDKIPSAKILKDVIDRTKSEKGTFYRGFRTKEGAKDLLSLKVGDIYQDKGFMSTDRTEDVAKNFSASKILLEITNNKTKFGTNLSVSSYSMHPEESEVLFNAGTKMKVKEILEKDGYIIYKVEVV